MYGLLEQALEKRYNRCYARFDDVRGPWEGYHYDASDHANSGYVEDQIRDNGHQVVNHTREGSVYLELEGFRRSIAFGVAGPTDDNNNSHVRFFNKVIHLHADIVDII